MRAVSQNPFRGLRSFELEDAPFFFGRDEVIDEILDRLDSRRAVALIGSSGSGKSSLIRAGVLPAILEDPTPSRIAVLRPGSDPVGSLAGALESAGISAPEARLRASSFGIVDCVSAAGASRERLVIVVDQFEEIFRLRAGAGRLEDADFFAALLAYAIASDASVYVLITLRADFIGELTRLPSLPEALSRALVLIPRMSRGQLSEAIERPVEHMHAAIERVCVQRILNDLNDVPDPLPRLQHVLMRMWESWQLDGTGRPIDLADYVRVGAMASALNLHADSLLAEVSEEQGRLAERMFQSLSAEEGGRIYGRAARVHEIAAAAASTSDMVVRVAEPFISAGLLSVSSQESGDPVLDVGHESLLREWTRLTEWVRQEMDARNTYLRLVDQATLHRQGMASLLRDPELTLAVNWRDGWRPNQAWAARYSALESFEAVLDYIDQSRDVEHRYRRRNLRTPRRRLAFGLLLLLLTVVVTLLALAMP